MREPSNLEINKSKELKTEPSKNLKIVLSLVDSVIAGQRFGEMDSKKQMYLMSCQTKIREMQEGYFDEAGVIFIYDIINSLSHKLSDARDELASITKKLEESER